MKRFTFYSTFDTLSNTIVFFCKFAKKCKKMQKNAKKMQKKMQKITNFSICEISCVLFFTNKIPSRMK